MGAVIALWKREIIKFVRDRSRVIGAVGQPLGFWLLLGFGFKGTFQMPTQAASNVGYMEFLFPGILAMVILFTAIFSTISIVEERKSGFLQAALVAPTSRTSIALGATLGGTTLALVQALMFLALIPLTGISLTLIGFFWLVLICTLTGIAFTALGVLIAWRMDSTRGFHAVMNLFLLPMWLLSGAVFPLSGVPPVLRWVMTFNPVTYSVAAMRQALYWPTAAPDVLVRPTVALIVCIAFAVLMMLLTTQTVRKPLFA